MSYVKNTRPEVQEGPKQDPKNRNKGKNCRDEGTAYHSETVACIHLHSGHLRFLKNSSLPVKGPHYVVPEDLLNLGGSLSCSRRGVLVPISPLKEEQFIENTPLYISPPKLVSALHSLAYKYSQDVLGTDN